MSKKIITSKKNLVIITSVIVTSKNRLSYKKPRSIYTVKDRFDQTLNTINSIKKYIPDSFIVLLECSLIPWKYAKQLKHCPGILYINNINNKEISNIVHKSRFKGYAELFTINYFLKSYSITNFNSFYKISGRYSLNKNFKYVNFNNTFNCFKKVNNPKIIKGIHTSTVFYKITNTNFVNFINSLTSKKKLLLNGGTIEKIISENILNIKNINILGVQGNLSGNGMFISY